jgi:hypothetical protein
MLEQVFNGGADGHCDELPQLRQNCRSAAGRLWISFQSDSKIRLAVDDLQVQPSPFSCARLQERRFPSGMTNRRAPPSMT